MMLLETYMPDRIHSSKYPTPATGVKFVQCPLFPILDISVASNKDLGRKAIPASKCMQMALFGTVGHSV